MLHSVGEWNLAQRLERCRESWAEQVSQIDMFAKPCQTHFEVGWTTCSWTSASTWSDFDSLQFSLRPKKPNVDVLQGRQGVGAHETIGPFPLKPLDMTNFGWVGGWFQQEEHWKGGWFPFLNQLIQQRSTWILDVQFFPRISWLPQSFILQVLNVWPQCCRKRPNSRRWAMRRHVVGQTRGALSKHSINDKSLHISTESLQNLYGILVNLYDIRFLVSNMSSFQNIYRQTQ